MAGRFYLPPISGYDQFEVVSSLRKSIKHRDVDQAIYWLQVLIENQLVKKAAKNLWIMAAEDIDEPMVVLRAFACFVTANKVNETDHLLYLTQAMCSAPHRDIGDPKPIEDQLVELAAAMCQARMWWETEEGRHIELLRLKAISEIQGAQANRREIPEYALDQHTRRGKAKAARGDFGAPGQLRDESSGSDIGRMKTIWQFLANGRLDPEFRLFDDDPEFQKMLADYGVVIQGKRVVAAPKPDEEPPQDLFGGELPAAGPPKYWLGCENWREWC